MSFKRDVRLNDQKIALHGQKIALTAIVDQTNNFIARARTHDQAPCCQLCRIAFLQALAFSAGGDGGSGLLEQSAKASALYAHPCGVVRKVCCDVSALRGAAIKLSPAPLLPPKLAHCLHELRS